MHKTLLQQTKLGFAVTLAGFMTCTVYGGKGGEILPEETVAMDAKCAPVQELTPEARQACFQLKKELSKASTRPKACLDLGILYVEANQYEEAFPYLEEASKAGFKEVWYYLGRVHHDCEDEKFKDDAKAYSYFHLAASLGEPKGMVSTARFLMNGYGGVPVDETKALEFYKQAADLGSNHAKLRFVLF